MPRPTESGATPRGPQRLDERRRRRLGEQLLLARRRGGRGARRSRPRRGRTARARADALQVVELAAGHQEQAPPRGTQEARAPRASPRTPRRPWRWCRRSRTRGRGSAWLSAQQGTCRCAGTALAHLVRHEREAQGPRLDAMAKRGAPDGGGPDGRRRLAVAPIPASADRPSLAAIGAPADRAGGPHPQPARGTVRAHRAGGSRSLRAGGPARAGGGGSADGAVPAAGPGARGLRGVGALPHPRREGRPVLRGRVRAGAPGRAREPRRPRAGRFRRRHGLRGPRRRAHAAAGGRPPGPDPPAGRGRASRRGGGRVAPGGAARRGAGPGAPRGVRGHGFGARDPRAAQLRAGGSGCRAGRPGADRRHRDPHSTDRRRCDRVRRSPVGLDGSVRRAGCGRACDPDAAGRSSLDGPATRAWRRCIASSTSAWRPCSGAIP